MAVTAKPVPGDRSVVERSPGSRLPDQILKWGLTSLAALILVLIVYFFIRLIGQSSSAISNSGLSFVFANDWDPSHNIFHGAALVVGTLI
ncbi:MAG: hypothetical protein JO244_00065, partial [Solirubrobacterales bacterium]|nr:hypothetical protein [Solirubrobacterales bacterium]